MQAYVAPLLTLGLIVAACSAGDGSEVASLDRTSVDAAPDGTVTTEPVDTEAALLEFAQCMRDNGIPEFEDPTVDENGNPQIFGNGAGPVDGRDSEARREAFEACGEHLEQIQLGFERPDRSELEDQLLVMAECMRDAGFDVDDPDVSSSGPNGGPGGGGFFGGVEFEDPAVQAALDACFEEAGITPGGPGGGPGRGPGGPGPGGGA